MKSKTIAYAAFLRGIGPGDPKKSNESLRNIFESCGFENVRSFIASGNILFWSPEKDAAKLERKVEKTFRETHGIDVGTFIRTRQEINAFLDKAPFGKLEHSKQTYLMVTFLKKDTNTDALKPHLQDTESGLVILEKEFNVVCSVVNTIAAKTPDFMQKLERLLSKNITTRTINTIERIAARL